MEKIKKIVVTGANGTLGHEITKIIDSVSLTKEKLDITKKEYAVLGTIHPKVIINCAAYTDVDKAETEKEKCSLVNIQGVKNLTEYCKNNDIILVNISTDYVFNGKKEGYDENDSKNPLNYYGKTKSEGEDIIINNLNKYYIIRTSWLFGKSGKNFVKTIINLSKEKKEIKVISDQIGCPTYAKDLANAIKGLIETEKSFGIYHVTNDGSCSWYGFAKEILKQIKSSCDIIPVSTKEYPKSAKRPIFSILINNKLNKLRNWKEALKEHLNEGGFIK